MRIFNEFGINPTTNYTAAGWDFYIPNIELSPEESDFIFESFANSYKKSVEELNDLLNSLVLTASAIYGEERVEGNEMNILLLYCMLDSPFKLDDDPIGTFVEDFLIFDEKGTPGISPEPLDQVNINSGIHVALNPGTVGVFLNKSGKGIKGWDIRAQVIDEDYAGCVHCSLAYTKNNLEDGIIYCGDKITQMLVWNLEPKQPIENMTKEDYYDAMKNSQRGSNAFGSSDEKH